jgi:hypothetical protein
MGLITIDSSALSVDNNSPTTQRRYAALLITHEIAHHVCFSHLVLRQFSNFEGMEGTMVERRIR